MEAIFRLPGGTRRSPAIDLWPDECEPELGAIARLWFEHMRRFGEDVRELLHDGCPTACVGDAAFAYVNVFRAHINVGFFHGVDLDDPAGLLEGGAAACATSRSDKMASSTPRRWRG